MRRHSPLSFAARRQVVERARAFYQNASLAQKTLLLDSMVEATGYTRKYAIHLLNQETEGKRQITRRRSARYGPQVQQALVQAWKAARHICAKRLIPFLPSLVAVLERHGHVRVTEEQRTHLLTMSVSTADRLLRAHRTFASPRGLSCTRAGPLLKQQIPLRTFEQWNETQPGFLEADLVAHCGGQQGGSFLWTLTLTDVVTGWTECLPLLYKSPEAVVAALQQAKQLFPFPILGLDVDNGGEFINERVMRYCEVEAITFTRGHPALKADQCFVEQKNGAIVRRMVGYDRLEGERACRQLRELYRAVRLYVNFFQPSMKLVSKHQEENSIRRVYDEAKTPLQRLVLSRIVSAESIEQLHKVMRALDPVSLLQQLEDLQQAVGQCASTVVPLAQDVSMLSFDLQLCMPEAPLADERRDVPISIMERLQGDQQQRRHLLDWPRGSRDPFEGQWEQILSLVLTHPEWSGGALFREMQRLFPGRYRSSHQRTLQSGLRTIRARLLPLMQESWPEDVIQAGVLHLIPPSDDSGCESDQHAAVGSPAGGPLSAPSLGEDRQIPALSAPSSSITKETSCIEGKLSSGLRSADQQVADVSGQVVSVLYSSVSPMSEPGAVPVNHRALTITHAIESYLQEQKANGRSAKTMEWHQTALGLLERYVVHERHLSWLWQITAAEIHRWIAFLQCMSSANGAVRSSSTVATYARSARAFCSWAVRKGYLESTPFVKGTIPNAERKPIHLIDAEEFERLLLACQIDEEGAASRAAVRNRTILWMFLDTGMRVSELCGLRLSDVNREQGTLRIGAGEKERWVPLSSPGLDQLLTYLDHSYPTRWKGQECRREEEPLFLTETYQPLTPNSITLLFGRLRERAGLDDRQVAPWLLRETFAVGYLLAGGELVVLCEILGLKDVTAARRYQRLADAERERSARRGSEKG